MMSNDEIGDVNGFEFLTALEDAALRFRDAGLLLPPVPRELAFEIEQRSEAMVYGSKDHDLTDRSGWFVRAQNADTLPCVLFGHTGHGVNSYNLYYQLVLGSLAVFVRQAFGGAYGDPAAEADRFNSTVESLEELLVHCDIAHKEGRIQPGQRLIVAIDEQEPSGWRLAPDGNWQVDDNPVASALTAIGAVPF